MTDSPSPQRPREPRQPAVPVRLTHAPTSQGLVVPYVTLAHRARTQPVWGKLDPVRLREILARKLCQICGQLLGDRVVLYLRPSDYLRGVAVEPGVHPECGAYTRRACPMLSGRTHRYNPVTGAHLSRCDDPDCGCAQWAVVERDPREAPREGQPAEAWYEAWLPLSDYTIVSDPGNDTTPPAVGVDIRAARLLKVRKIRDAAPTDAGDQPVDLLAALIVSRKIFGSGGDLW